jgi:PPOX class probable F420-dependent enzyme
MPRVPVPQSVDEFLRRHNPAVVATVRRDGSPYTAPTWYDWDGNRVYLNMDAGRLRLDHMRRDPRAALSVLEDGNWYRHVSLLGAIVSIEDDPELTGIDRLAIRYTGEPYPDRSRHRVGAWLEPDRWHAWPPDSF